MNDCMIAEIGVEKCSVSFDRLYSYTVPDRLSDALEPGARVFVPFGMGDAKRQGFVFSLRKAEERYCVRSRTCRGRAWGSGISWISGDRNSGPT